jgi:predicted ATPase/DNA-binding SARP family transcriptional activator/Tfp pilus assembly protein PilF
VDVRCRIELFGPLRVVRGDQVLTRFRTQKAGWLLAYLALNAGQAHSRDHMIELFWPDLDFDAGRDNLSTSLSALRRLLEPAGVPAGSVLNTDRRNVQLNPIVSTDVGECEAVLRSAAQAPGPEERAALLKRAVEILSGDLLVGCDEEWAIRARRLWRERRVSALLEWAGLLEPSGDLETALRAAQQASAIDPYREETYQVQIRLLFALGRSADALETYAALERFLSENVGVAPSAATKAVVERAREVSERQSDVGLADGLSASEAPLDTREANQPVGDAGTAQATAGGSAQSAAPIGFPPHEPSVRERAGGALTLPLSWTQFFGREREIDELLDLLRPHPAMGGPSQARPAPLSGRLVTLIGPGGAGKTRLAIETARRAAPAFTGGVWFVSLAELPDPRLIPSALVSALQLPTSPVTDPLERIVGALDAAPCLILLDNFEHLLGDVHGKSDGLTPGAAIGLVRLLLERAPGLTCLATSRQPLQLSGEHEFPVPPMPTPGAELTRNPGPDPRRETSILMEFPSVALYADRARKVKPDFELAAHNAAAVATLCRRLEGMPLAIEMAAAWAMTIPPKKMLERLERQLDLLVSRRHDLPARHRSLRATSEWSYDLLSPSLQHCFARLSVFRGGFTREAAEAVFAAPSDPAMQIADGSGDTIPALSSFSCILHPSETLDLLTSLAERSLIVAEGGDEPRYRMLESLREFAAERLAEQNGSEPVSRAHATYFVGLVNDCRKQLHGPQERRWLDRLEADHDNVRAALNWLMGPQGDVVEATRLVGALWEFWLKRGHAAEGLRRLKTVLAAGENVSGRERFALLNGGASLSLNLGDFAAARAYLEELVALSARANDVHYFLLSCNNLAIVAFDQGDHALARHYWEETLRQSRANDFPNYMGAALNNLGELAYDTGELSRATPLLEESLFIQRRLGHRGEEARCLNNLGKVSLGLGDTVGAAAHYRASLVIRRDIADRLGSIETLEGLAGLLVAQGEANQAVFLLAASQRSRKELGFHRPPNEQRDYDLCLQAAREALQEPQLARAWERGSTLTLDDAIQIALAEEE